jgi:cytochrome c-type biogenesis protein CcmE
MFNGKNLPLFLEMFHVKHKHQRLLLILGALVSLGVAATLMLVAFEDNLVFFYTPIDLLHKKIPPEQRIRVGGLVEPHSLVHQGEKVTFKITDQKETLEVIYQGLLPDLFREDQGVVAEGYLLQPSLFHAESVLAKHDEAYMPKEVADQLKKQGVYRNAQ